MTINEAVRKDFPYCSARSTAAAGLPRQRRDDFRSLVLLSTRWSTTTRTTTPASTAACTRSRSRRPTRTKRLRAKVGALHQVARRSQEHRLHPQRHRGAEPGRQRLGPQEPSARRRDRAQRHRAPQQSRALAAHRQGKGAVLRSSISTKTDARADQLKDVIGPDQSRVAGTRLECTRYQPGAWAADLAHQYGAIMTSSTAPRACRTCPST